MSSRYFKYALMDYLPKRFLGHASFEAQEDSRHILDFKAGRKYAVDKASKLVGNALSLMDLKDTIIVCIPACSPQMCTFSRLPITLIWSKPLMAPVMAHTLAEKVRKRRV